jgi:hypothetical protein
MPVMEAYVQFWVVQYSVEDDPWLTCDGLAEKPVMVQTVGCVAATVTVVVAVGECTPSEAVSVYVVVANGVTWAEPDGTWTDPTAGDMAAYVQFWVVQYSVEDAPCAICCGDAEKPVMVQTVAGGGVGVGVGLTTEHPFSVACTVIWAIT